MQPGCKRCRVPLQRKSKKVRYMIHEHHHHHEEKEEGRGRIIKIVSSVVLLIAASIIERRTAWADWQYLLMFLVPYLIEGWENLK